MKPDEFYTIYTNTGEVVVPRSVVINGLKEIYRLTQEEDIDVALDVMRTFYRKNEELATLTHFVSKLLHLDASGRVKPPINFGPTYDLAIEEVNRESQNINRSYFNLRENFHYVEQVLGKENLRLERPILFDLYKIQNNKTENKISLKR
ncbi:MAG: hypothetical protein QXM53_07650 [Thermofilaceae archaeon]